MNCANHLDRERAAFCQHCGKPLCTECVRNVGTSVFCEPCLTARVASTAPAGYPYPGYPYPGQPQPGPGYSPAGAPSRPGEPNPVLAALLGFIPGVGAMYNEQYAKGIVHLIVFAVFVSLASDVNDIFGLFVFGWMCYMVAEAYHTARARRDGTPLPNPFGLNDLSERLGFGRAWPGGVPPAQPGAAPGVAPSAGPSPQDPGAPPASPYSPPYSYSYVPPVSQWAVPPDPAAYGVPPIPPMPPMPQYPDPNLPNYRRFPSAAIWLIVLGALFLLGNIPALHLVLHGRLLGPFLLIGGGVWLFVRRMAGTGPGFENDGSAYYQWRLQRAIRGAFWLVFVGVIWLLDALRILTWSHSWPLFLIGGGVMLFFKHAFSPGYGYGYVPPPSATPPTAAPGTIPVTSTELVPADPRAQPGSSDRASGDQEGR
jgi:TM2 domain-containing membrane protein YozV